MRFGMVKEPMENSNGTFSMKNGEEILSAAKENGCKFVCVLRDKTPPLTPELKTKFINYSRFLLDKYRHVIDKVEIWNEWTNGTGTYSQYQAQQTAVNYADLVSSIYPVLKSEYPDVEFIGLGGINPQRFRNDIVDMFAAGAGQNMDAISMHPYRQPKLPESRTRIVKNLTMDEQILDVVDLAKTYNAPQKVYITEIGQPGNLMNNGKPDLTQAHYLVKVLGLLLASNVVEQIDWYNLYDEDEIGIDSKYTKPEEYEQFHFGLFEGLADNHAVKTAALAYRFFAKITAGFATGERYDNGEGFFRLTLRDKTSGELDIVWDNANQSQYRLVSGHKAYDLMGNLIETQGIIQLTREPVYIVKSEFSALVDQTIDNTSLHIYPNPTNEFIRVKLPESFIDGKTTMEIRNISGTLIGKSEALSPETTLCLKDQPSGFYVVNALNRNVTINGIIIKN